MRNRLKKITRRFAKEEHGFGTAEFIIIFPVFMMLLLSGYEIGILMTRQTVLERGVDLAVRDLRLGQMSGGADDKLDESDVRRAICNFAGIIPDCMNALHIELRQISTTSWNMPNPQADCVDRSENIRPAVAFNPGQANEMMMIRACVIVDPIFPGSGLGAQLPVDASGGYQLISMSAFVNEPL